MYINRHNLGSNLNPTAGGLYGKEGSLMRLKVSSLCASCAQVNCASPGGKVAPVKSLWGYSVVMVPLEFTDKW